MPGNNEEVNYRAGDAMGIEAGIPANTCELQAAFDPLADESARG